MYQRHTEVMHIMHEVINTKFSSEDTEKKPPAKCKEGTGDKKNSTMFRQGDYIMIKRTPFRRRRGHDSEGVGQSKVVLVSNGCREEVDGLDRTVGACFGGEISNSQSQRSIEGDATTATRVPMSSQEEQLSTPSYARHHPSSLTQALLSQDAAKARILQEYDELRGGGVRETATRHSTGSMSLSGFQSLTGREIEEKYFILPRQTLELEIERLEIEYARIEFH